MSKIKVFLRHWNGAINRKQNIRPDWFSYEKCYRSVKNANIDLVILLDGLKSNHHFSFDKEDLVIEYKGGSDEASLLFCLNQIQNFNFKDNDIVYIVEDDYLHMPNWENILKECFNELNPDYATLYDHFDKYTALYPSLVSRILPTASVHWRTTPSTCNTYACKMSTLRKHWDIHIKYCLPEYTHLGYDHTKFTDLWKIGSNLISCIPGYSTHCEKDLLSPTVNWALFCS